MKRFFTNLFIVSALSLAFCACNDEADNGGKTEDSGFGSGTQGEMLSPSEQKDELTAIVNELITTMEASQFEESVDSIFGILESVSTVGSLPKELMKQIGSFVTELQEAEIGSFAEYTSPDNTIFFNYEDYYGVYTYDDVEGEWIYEESDSELKLIVDGNALRFTASGKIKLSSEMQNKEVPTQVNITLTDSTSEKLFGVTAKISEFDIATMKYKCSVEGVYGPLTVNASETFGDKKGEVRLSIKHNKKLLISTFAGVGDVNLDLFHSSEVTDGTDDTDTDTDTTSDLILDDATLYINVLDKLHFCGSISDLNELTSKIEEYDEQYSVKVGSYSYCKEEYYQKTVDLLNDHISLGWNYDNSKVFVGEIEFDYDYDVEIEETYCNDDTDIIPIMLFKEDNSRYHFGEYFTENAFGSVIESAQELIKSYSEMLSGGSDDNQ